MNLQTNFELEHDYGNHVHILENLWLRSALARISGSEVRHPEITTLLREIYTVLCVTALGAELPQVQGDVPTRMAELHPAEGHYRGPILDPSTEVVIVDIVRAGILPAQVCFELLNSVLPDPQVRLDHLHMARIEAEDGSVAGVDLSGSKIGGSVEGRILVLPDPMGATGTTTCKAVDHYIERYGRPAKVLALPMIATPEYLRAVTDHVENLSVYTLRLDRGLSSQETLQARPGELWEQERGLNEKGYIVPGAGGMGEVLNNSWC